MHQWVGAEHRYICRIGHQAALRNAQLDYDRKASLAGQQLVARSDVDLARAALDQAKAQIERDQASLE